MAQSNYDIMQERMEEEFLKYDQESMINKFNLEHDKEYLYIVFVARKYRISRTCGKVEWSDDGFVNVGTAGYNEAMSMYDLLCCSKKNCLLSGNFVQIRSAKGSLIFSNPGSTMYQKFEAYCDDRMDALRRACELLGGTPRGKGDVSYEIKTFEFLPIIFEFWESDEDFPPSVNFFWDENILEYVKFETSFFIAGHVIDRICELMGAC